VPAPPLISARECIVALAKVGYVRLRAGVDHGYCLAVRCPIVGRPWLGRVGAYAMGLAGLYLAAEASRFFASDRHCAADVWLWEARQVATHGLHRADVLGTRYYGGVPTNTLGWRIGVKGFQVARDARQAAREHKEEGRLARVARIELPVETPVEPSLVALR